VVRFRISGKRPRVLVLRQKVDVEDVDAAASAQLDKAHSILDAALVEKLAQLACSLIDEELPFTSRHRLDSARGFTPMLRLRFTAFAAKLHAFRYSETMSALSEVELALLSAISGLSPPS
jgi:hypothetical protein